MKMWFDCVLWMSLLNTREHVSLCVCVCVCVLCVCVLCVWCVCARARARACVRAFLSVCVGGGGALFVGVV